MDNSIVNKQKPFSIGLLLFAIFSLSLLLLIHSHSMMGVTWATVVAFLKSYGLLLLTFVGIRFYDSYIKKDSDTLADLEATERLKATTAQFLKFFRIGGLSLIGILISFFLWQEYQANIADNEHGATVIHFLFKELWELIQLGGEWIRKHVLIIVLLKNPCVNIAEGQQICLEDYPIASYILAFSLLAAIRKSLKFPWIKEIAQFLVEGLKKLLVGFLNLLGKLFRSTDLKALSVALFSQTFLKIWQEVKELDPWVAAIEKAILSKFNQKSQA